MAKQVQVLQFMTENSPQTNSDNNTNTEAMLSTHEMSFCFWMMPQSYKNFVLIHTKQLHLWFRGVDGGYVLNINYTPLNDTEANIISRMLRFCQTYTVGSWFSSCLSVKFTEMTQQVKFYINGVKCKDQTFPVEELKSMIYPERALLEDL